MSRDLPPNPNLEHLKKQAKVLLEKLRQQNADATLVDAQHALAREYGFPSWPKLKEYVEAKGAEPLADLARIFKERMVTGIADSMIPKASTEGERKPGLFDRFTTVLRQALFFSRFEASSLGRLRIRPEHVLLGIIRSDGRSTRDLWRTSGVTLDEARTAVVIPDEPRDVIVEPVQIPFQDSTKGLFTSAGVEADRLGHQRIATAHVVLALMREESAASLFLRSRGITLEAASVAAAMAESPLADEDQ